MTATVHQLPFAATSDRPSLNLSEDEVREAAGGYRRPADQLKELQRRGFVRAYRSGPSGKVVLERGHYDAVISGHFGQPASNEPEKRAPAQPDRAGFLAVFGKKGKA